MKGWYVGDKPIEVRDPEWGYLYPVYSYHNGYVVAYFENADVAQIVCDMYNGRIETKGILKNSEKI